MSQAEILFNAFNMNSVGHIAHGLWTHPRDTSAEYTDLAYWTDLAKTLERGKFDGLFLADIVGVYDVYQGTPDLTLRETIQLPINDPTLIVPAMAAVTEHLGFGVTTNLTWETPYLFARRYSTLDHLTKGRLGWNIVTGYLDSAARGMGLAEQIGHDHRYDRADDFMTAVYKLWEGSWADDAVVRDRARRVFAQPDRVRRVRHQGPYYQLDAIHLSEPSPQRTPVLFQAGSSDRGRSFAATHAECVFVNGQSKALARQLVDEIRADAVAQGRAPGDIKVFVGATVIVGRTEAEAQAKYADYQRHASPEAGLAHFSASTGIDFSRYGLDEPIRYVKTEAMASAVEAVTKRAQEQVWTVRKLLALMTLGSRNRAIVGDPRQVADELQSWVREAGVDGFNLIRTVAPEGFEDIVDLLVPELQARGVYKTEYAPGTLREKLFGPGRQRLAAPHPAAQWRFGADAAAPVPQPVLSTAAG